jgi:hypothetical protein
LRGQNAPWETTIKTRRKSGAVLPLRNRATIVWQRKEYRRIFGTPTAIVVGDCRLDGKVVPVIVNKRPAIVTAVGVIGIITGMPSPNRPIRLL